MPLEQKGDKESDKVKKYFYFIRRKNGTERSRAEQKGDKEGRREIK